MEKVNSTRNNWGFPAFFTLLTFFTFFTEAKEKRPPIDLFEHFEKTPVAGIEHVARGVYRIGKVQVDQVRGTVAISGRMNAPTWVDVEYLAVAERGKDHESLIVVEAEPFHINLALILLGLTGGEPLARQGEARTPKGSRVRIWVEWTLKGKTAKVPAEEFVWDRETNRPMERTTWVYTGSRFDEEGRYLAQITRSVIATYHDPDALLDHPLKGGASPHQYGPNVTMVPPEGTPLTIWVEREPETKKGEKK